MKPWDSPRLSFAPAEAVFKAGHPGQVKYKEAKGKNGTVRGSSIHLERLYVRAQSRAILLY